MFGFSPMAAKAFVILAAATACPAPAAAPFVQYDLAPQPETIDASVLKDTPPDAIGSLYIGIFPYKVDVNISRHPVAGTDLNCLVVDNVVVHMQVANSIHIPPTIAPGTCKYDGVRKYFKQMLYEIHLDFTSRYQPVFSAATLAPLAAISLAEPLDSRADAQMTARIKRAVFTAVQKAEDNLHKYLREREAEYQLRHKNADSECLSQQQGR